MRPLTQHEKRTIRLAAIALSIYLALFYGARVVKKFEARRSEYQKLVQEAGRLRTDLERYENKVLLIEKLEATFHLEPEKLSRATLVAEAGAAIQQAATSGGIQLGPIRESPARPSAQELASMQIEAVGPVPAVTAFLHRLETLGFPLLFDSVQFAPEPSKPGMTKMSLTIVILDFEQWKKEEPRHA